MQIHRLIRDTLIFTLLAYFGQGVLYSSGSFISQLFLVLILMISGFYFISSFFIYKGISSSFYFAWTIFFLLNIVGFVFTGDFYDPEHYAMFKAILINFLVFYPFYYFAKIGVLKTKHLTRFFFVMLPLLILQFFMNEENIIDSRLSDNENVVNNIAYSFVWLIPFLFLFRNKIFSLLFISIILFFIIEGAKRGAIITGVIGALIFLYYIFKKIKMRSTVISYLFVTFLISSFAYFTYQMFLSNEFLQDRFSSIDEGGSGRDIIFMNITNAWINSDNIINLLFGYGFAASWKFAGNYAHNDWLELLSNFGLIGIIIYIYLFYYSIKYLFTKSWNADKKLLMLTIVVMWFIITIFSMGYTNSSNGFLRSMMLAFLVGSITAKEKRIYSY